MKPKVTVGVCVRNCEGSIKEVIDSIVNQDFPHELMEIIIVDDGSEDRTLSIVLDLASKMGIHARVFHTEWRGLGPARDLVVKETNGKYIVWVDGDMVLSRGFVRKQAEFMEQNCRVGIAKGRYAMLPNENLVATLENISFVVNNTKYESGTGGSIYQVEAIRQVGGFDKHLKIAGEDQDVAYRVKAAGWTVCRTNSLFYERPRTTWKALWAKYFCWGYGLHDTLQKNRYLLTLYRMVPLAGFLSGLLHSFIAYRLTRQKRVFLLPLHFTFKLTAWCWGYMRSHIDSYLCVRKSGMENKSIATTEHFHEVARIDELPSENRVSDWIKQKLCLRDPWYQLILKMMKPVIKSFKGKKVLEVGCGLGGFCIRVAKEDGKSIGLDISSDAIHKAKDLAKKYAVQNRVDFIIGDAQFLPIKTRATEIVVCSETLEHVANHDQAFHELVRVTKKSGFLCLTVPNLLSTLFFEYVFFLFIGQPKFVKKFLNVERESIFHYLKVKRLLSRKDLKVLDIRGTDFLHLHPKITRALRMDRYTKLLSGKLEKKRSLRFFGANIGVLTKKV